jgi:hypothetical protein
MISNYFSDICGGNGYIRLLSNVCVKLSRVNCTLQEAAYSQPQVIKFTSCFPMVGGSLLVLRLLPSIKLVVMI